MLTVALLTVGDPSRLSGGYRYHLRMAEAAPRNDARVEFVSLPDRPWPAQATHARSALARVASVGAEALLLDSIAAAPMAPLLCAGRLPAPLMAIVHQPPGGIDHGQLRTPVQAWLDRLAYRRSRHLFAASSTLADDLMQAGFPGARITVVPPGRDTVAPAEGPLPDLRRGRRAALLCVANWLPRKGIPDLLEAMARLPRDAALLHLAGDDQADRGCAASIRGRLSDPDLRDRVVVHGPLPAAQVAALYAAADIFVLPSTREPYGTVYGEAMAFGLPVVGWRAGNLPHLADDGREGLVLAVGDVPRLAAGLLRLADDERLRRRLGAAARRRAERLPRWEDSAAALFDGIRRALDHGDSQ